jgi:osmotically inducible protein OsmC
VNLDSSGTGRFDVSWPARTAEPGGKTSPEELIAAAEASCYSMALSHGLSQAGATVKRLDTTVTVSIEQGDGGFAITRAAVRVRGDVDGVDEAGFVEAAEAAKSGCPVSKALSGNVELTLDAALA